MHGQDGFATGVVYPGHSAADAADKFIVKAIGSGGNLLYGDFLVAAATDQNDGIFRLDVSI